MIQSKAPATTPVSSRPKHPAIAIAGASGVGKTTMLGTVGQGNKVLIADTEGGSISFNSPWFQAHEDAAALDDIHVISFEDVTKWPELVEKTEGTLDYLIGTKNKDGYSLFAIDSLSELQELFLVLHNAPDPRQSYGAFKDLFHTLVVKAKQAPLPVVFTTRLRATHDEVLGRDIIRPEVSPSAWSVAGLLDAVGFYELDVKPAKTSRRLTFEHSVRYPGKDRIGLGVAELIDPAFTDIQALLAGETPEPKKKAAKKPPFRSARGGTA